MERDSSTVSLQQDNKREAMSPESDDHVDRPTKKLRTALNVVIRPSDYVRAAFKANGASVDAVRSQCAKKFMEPTPEMLGGYNSEILMAVRKNDLGKV